MRTRLTRAPSALASLAGWGLAAWGLVGAAGGCSFSGAATSNPEGGDAGSARDDGGDDGGDDSWWDAEYAFRQRLTVTTDAVVPDKGYLAYTVRLGGLDTAGLVAAARMQRDCDDLRLVFFDGETWTEAARDLTDCDTAFTSIAFALPTDLNASTVYAGAALYYGNPDAGAGPLVSPENVYLWSDDAASDRGALYDHGRMDAWLASGHDDSLSHNPAGYYEYSTGDDSQSSYRRAVDERDVLVEAETFHTDCFPLNMQTGVCVRGIIGSGSGASEQSDHYYCTSRAQNPNCADDDQDLYDGDIVKRDNEEIAVDGNLDPPAIVASQWRKQALAAFGVNPTELRFWDADTGWSALAFPPLAALRASGPDTDDFEGRGFAGLMTAQDAARVRRITIRRYVEPEPIVVLDGSAESGPDARPATRR